MVVFDVNTPVIHGKAHPGSQVIPYVRRQGIVVAGTGLQLITLVILVIPCGKTRLGSEYFRVHVVVIGAVLDAVENIEFIFRPDHHLVGDADLFHVFQRPDGHVPWILVEGPVLRKIDDPHIPYHRQGGNLRIPVDHRRFQHRNENHIAVFDRRISVIGTVKTYPMFHDACRQPFRRNA